MKRFILFSFVAAAILQIEADPKYKFNINQPLSKWLPQYPQWGNITVKQLLNHIINLKGLNVSRSGW